MKGEPINVKFRCISNDLSDTVVFHKLVTVLSKLVVFSPLVHATHYNPLTYLMNVDIDQLRTFISLGRKGVASPPQEKVLENLNRQSVYKSPDWNVNLDYD